MRRVASMPFDSLLARGRLAQYFSVRHGGQQRTQAIAKQGVVVGKENAGGVHTKLS